MLVSQVCPLTFWPKNWFKFKAKSNHEANYEADCVKGKIQYICFGQRFYLNSEPRHWVQSYYILFYPQTLFLQSTSLIGPGGIEHIVWTSDAGQTDREKKGLILIWWAQITSSWLVGVLSKQAWYTALHRRFPPPSVTAIWPYSILPLVFCTSLFWKSVPPFSNIALATVDGLAQKLVSVCTEFTITSTYIIKL